MKKAKLGIIGLGRLGMQHAYNIVNRIPNAELVAGCSVDETQLQKLRDELEVKYTCKEFEDILKMDDLDAIVIASPNNLHCEHVCVALEAGHNIFLEKPVSLNLDELAKVKSAYAKHPDAVLQVGFNRRFDASFLDAKKKIESGLIGEPFIAKCNGLDPASSREALVKYCPTSGGIFVDMSAHDFDLAHWYLNVLPKSVYALGGVYVFEELKALNQLDNASISMEFENNKLALFHTSRTAHHGYHLEIQIMGTEGSMTIGAVPQKNLVTVFDKNGAHKDCVTWYLDRFEDSYLTEMQSFVDCLLSGSQPLVGFDAGEVALRMSCAATKSFEVKQVVTL